MFVNGEGLFHSMSNVSSNNYSNYTTIKSAATPTQLLVKATQQEAQRLRLYIQSGAEFEKYDRWDRFKIRRLKFDEDEGFLYWSKTTNKIMDMDLLGRSKLHILDVKDIRLGFPEGEKRAEGPSMGMYRRLRRTDDTFIKSNVDAHCLEEKFLTIVHKGGILLFRSKTAQISLWWRDGLKAAHQRAVEDQKNEIYMSGRTNNHDNTYNTMKHKISEMIRPNRTSFSSSSPHSNPNRASKGKLLFTAGGSVPSEATVNSPQPGQKPHVAEKKMSSRKMSRRENSRMTRLRQERKQKSRMTGKSLPTIFADESAESDGLHNLRSPTGTTMDTKFAPVKTAGSDTSITPVSTLSDHNLFAKSEPGALGMSKRSTSKKKGRMTFKSKGSKGRATVISSRERLTKIMLQKTPNGSML